MHVKSGLIVAVSVLCLEAQAPAGRRGGGGIGRAGSADATVVDAAKADRGKRTYVQFCAFCHGADAGGQEEGGADLIRSVVVAHDRYGEEIGKVIRSGVPAKNMPAFNFSEVQIEEMAHFLHQKVKERAQRNTYSIQNVLTGNAKAGEAYFKGAGKCGTCHSPAKDLAGIGKRYDPLTIQQRFLFPRGGRGGGRGGASGVAVTVTPPSGRSVSGELVHLDDFSVALRDSSGEYHSWRLDVAGGAKVEVRDPLAAHIELLDKYTDADMHNVVAYLESLK